MNHSRALFVAVGLALASLATAARGQGFAPGRASGESELARPPDALIEAVQVTERLRARVPLDARFLDSAGHATTLGAALGGELPVLLTFNYSSCPALCSLHLNGLVKALAASRYSVGKQVRIVTITLAPDEPVAEVARTRDRYLAKLAELGGKPDPRGWTFLVAERADDDRAIHAIADAVGFGYRYIPTQREYAHPAATIALSAVGTVTRYLHGVEVPVGELDETIARAGLDEPSAAAGFAVACLHWDASANSKRWGGTVMKFAALGFLAIGLLVGGALVARHRRRPPGVDPS
ncbi:MAG: SCO family protein [Kofleriaceae bacterium]